jgi:hypothetical protein
VDIWDTDKVVLFVEFVIPGFVSLKTYQLLTPSSSKESDKLLIDAVAYSCINYAILLWPIWYVREQKISASHPYVFAAFVLFALLVAPILWVVIVRWVRGRRWLQKFIPHPAERAWDYVFGRRRRNWIVVTFKDGKRVGGRYDTDSFSTSAPCEAQIYFEEAWFLNDDGGFERPREGSDGLLVVSSEISTIEFFRVDSEGEENDGQKRACDQGLPAGEGPAAATQ